MTDQKSNSTLWIIIIGVIVLFAVIFWINKNDNPIPNEGSINKNTSISPRTKSSSPQSVGMNAIGASSILATGRQQINMRRSDDMSDNIVDELVSQYDDSGENIAGSAGYYVGSPVGSDSKSDQYGNFDGYLQKKQLNMKKSDQAYCDDSYDNRDFSYKKKSFTRRTPEDVKDLFDINKMMPQEIEEEWFDIEPLQSTKKIKGSHLIHPKVHMGVNTVGGSLRNGTHDIRGDIPNPKINVSPWNISTIEPDTNIRGICNPI